MVVPRQGRRERSYREVRARLRTRPRGEQRVSAAQRYFAEPSWGYAVGRFGSEGRASCLCLGRRAVRGRPRVREPTGADAAHGRRRRPRRHALRAEHGAAARRLSGDRALSRPRQRPAQPRAGGAALRQRLRRAGLRHARPRPVGRARLDRRPARDRRRPRGLQPARRSPRDRQDADRCLGDVARRRRRAALARRRRLLEGGRDGPDLDRPLQRSGAAEPRQVGGDLPVPELGTKRAARPVRARDPRRRPREPQPRLAARLGRGPLEPEAAEDGGGARLHVPGPPRLRLRHCPGEGRLRTAEGTEAALHR